MAEKSKYANSNANGEDMAGFIQSDSGARHELDMSRPGPFDFALCGLQCGGPGGNRRDVDLMDRPLCSQCVGVRNARMALRSSPIKDGE